MKWDVGRGRTQWEDGKEATMEIENLEMIKQIEGCITSDDAEIYNTMLKNASHAWW